MPLAEAAEPGHQAILQQLALIANALDVSLYYLIGIQEESYRELSPETRKVADAYQFADPMVKEIIKRLLVIK